MKLKFLAISLVGLNQVSGSRASSSSSSQGHLPSTLPVGSSGRRHMTVLSDRSFSVPSSSTRLGDRYLDPSVCNCDTRPEKEATGNVSPLQQLLPPNNRKCCRPK